MEYTAEQITQVIDTFVNKQKRLPKTSELVPILDDLPANKIQPHLMQYIKKLKRLIVLPNGMIRDDDGTAVWYRNSAGSMTLARYKNDPDLGNTISG